MKCNDILLEDYVEGFLNTAEKTELVMHLSSCNKCQQTLENLRAEQRLLATTLNETQLKSGLTENLMQEIKQQKKIKARRHRYQMMFITAAILMISFTLIATMNKPSQHADVLPPDTSQDIEANQQHVADTEEESNTHGIPLHVGPVLDIKIDSVIEKNGMKEITYRANYNEAMQQYSEATLRKLVSTYQLDAQEFPLRHWHGLISIAVRNSKNEVVATFEINEKGSIEPIYPGVSKYSQATDVLGEGITHFSLPVETDPTTFEIVGYLAELPTFAEPFTFKKNENTSFDYLGHTYTIYDTQLKDDGLHLSISVDGQPEITPSGWHITFNGTRQRHITYFKVENNQTILSVILPGMQTIPDEMTMLPYLGIIQENFKPSIILDLKETVNN
ncbi:anti-sigma factor family protein [Solibacillus cecembensis]|uniref:anti-sigma factor family protein n=1 Tax=Solibacillus cecembensis TaxID=459347 RepID=UPI003D0275BA